MGVYGNLAIGASIVSLAQPVARRITKRFGGIPTMKKAHYDTVVRERITLSVSLTLLLGLPFAFANRAVANPIPKFAYVTNRGDGTVSAYTINSSTGSLSAVPGSPFQAGIGPTSVAVDPSNRFAYVANLSGGSARGHVSAYTINSSTGALSAIAGSPFKAGNTPYGVTVDPSGRFAYVANLDGDNVSAYAINSSTGALREVAGSPFAAGVQPTSVAVDPSGQFVYVANSCFSSSICSEGTVSAYTINSSTGALRKVAGSPFPAGVQPTSVTVDPSGRFAYVANECVPCSRGNVSAYTIDNSTGALHAVAGSPFAAADGPSSVTVDASGHFAYVSNQCLTSNACVAGNLTGAVSAYTINGTTGALHAITGSPFAAGDTSVSVTVDPSGRFAYVANLDEDTVSAYTINSSTGALSAVAGSPYATRLGPSSVAIAGEAVANSVLTLAPRSLAFGNLPVHTSSAAQSVTVTNTSAQTVAIMDIALRGTAPGQFTFTDDCGKSLAAYRTCTLEAIFKPTTQGAKTAFLDVNGGGGGLRSVMLTGKGT